MTPPLRLLVLGTGSMARTHVLAFQAMSGVAVVAGCDIDLKRASAFCATHSIPQAFGDLEGAIAWGGFDAAVNVTPDGVHYATTMALLAAGKPVFCEKPLAPNYAQANEMARVADKAGLVNMVNLTYRNVPALHKTQKMIAAGDIGDIRHVEASYRQSWLVANNWGDWKSEPRWLWRLSHQHGSMGVLGDVGIHILDFATFSTGLEIADVQARLKTFAKAPGDSIGDYKLDANDSAVMSVAFSNGALGIIHASRFMTGYANSLILHVYGTKGALELDHSQARTNLRACLGEDVHTQAWRDVICPATPTTYEKFIAAVRSRDNGDPDFRRAADLQRVLDACVAGAKKTD